jgi:hypothetical protein
MFLLIKFDRKRIFGDWKLIREEILLVKFDQGASGYFWFLKLKKSHKEKCQKKLFALFLHCNPEKKPI